MAQKFWVGGTGTWDTTTKTHWSNTTGGASGANVPTSNDTVNFDANSNGTDYTVTIFAGTVSANGANIANPTGGTLTLTNTGTSKLSITGNINASATVLCTFSSSMTMQCAINTASITSSGTSWGQALWTLNSGTWSLADDFAASSNNSYFRVAAAVFNTNNHNMNVGSFDSSDNSSNRTINLGSSTITLLQDNTSPIWSMGTTPTRLTFNCGTSLITMPFPTLGSGVFQGAGLTYYNVRFTGTAATVYTIDGNNAFNNIQVSTPPHTLKFTAGQTQTITTITLSGTAGNLVTLNSSSAGSQWTIQKPYGSPGVINQDYLVLQDSNAATIAEPANSTGVFFAGTHSTNTSNNTGWTFGAGADYGIQVFDSVTVSEHSQVNNFEPSVFDAVSLTENFQSQINTNCSVFDAITVTENIQLVVLAPVIVGDDVAITDVPILVIPFLFITVSDAVVVAEVVSVFETASGSAVDLVSVQDVPTILIPKLVPLVFETITITENIALQESAMKFTTFDTVTVVDNISAATIYDITVFDLVTVSENYNFGLSYIPFSLFDSVAVSDVPTVRPGVSISVFDSVTVSDILSTNTSNSGPALTADDAGVGNVAWTNVTNAEVIDGIFATAVLVNTDVTHYIDGTQFGFAVPNYATINGVQVQVRAKTSNLSVGPIFFADLIKGGVINPDGSGQRSMGFFNTSLQTLTAGSSVDLWAETLAPTDVNASNFGVAIHTYANAGGTSSVDGILMTVYYSYPMITLTISPPTLQPQVNDTVTVTESVTVKTVPLAVSVFEAIAVSENLVIRRERDINTTFDTVTVTESSTIVIPRLFIVVSESISVVDAMVYAYDFPTSRPQGSVSPPSMSMGGSSLPTQGLRIGGGI